MSATQEWLLRRPRGFGITNQEYTARTNAITITLDISQDAEAKLQRKASRRGLTLSQFLEQIASAPADDEPMTPANGAELVALWDAEGVFGAWADRADIGDGAQYARDLRTRAQQRGWPQ